MSGRSRQKVLFGLFVSSPAPQSISLQMKRGIEERGIVRCLSISTTHYHIMSLVSRSDRSGLRSLVQAAVRFKVSHRAQKSSTLRHNQALLITRCLLGLRFPCSSSSSSSTLRPPLCLCTTLPCLALRTAEVSHFFIASFVWLVLPQRRRHAVCCSFSIFHSLSLPSYHSSLATFTTFEHHCKFVYIVIRRDSPRLLCLQPAMCVVIYKLYI